MEYSTHWATMVKCNLCGKIPESAPLFQCPFQHQYCLNCIEELKKNYRGNLKGGSTCIICKVSGVFVQSRINTDFLNKIKFKPGIGRPYRYATNTGIQRGHNYPRVQEETTPPSNEAHMTIEGLFQLPSEEIRKLLCKKYDTHNLETNNCNEPFDKECTNKDECNSSTIQQNYISSPSHSRIPIQCPHNRCKKMVAVSSFVTHFKHEHNDIPKYNIERGKELCIPCDLSLIEHNSHICLAMITVYEINRIDVNRSRSSQSVIKTCSRFCQQVPINSFWLMTTGSAERRQYCSYAVYWLFTTTEEDYQCTIELSSKHDSVTLSTFCGVNCSSKSFSDVPGNLKCLIITKSSLGSLLKEGPEINLRITIH